MNATNIGSSWKAALEDALDGQPIGTTVKRERDNEEWEVGNGNVIWASSSWGTVKIEIESGFKFGTIQKKDRFTVAAPILLNGRQTQIIPFYIEATGTTGIHILRTQDEKMEDVTDNVGHRLPTWSIAVNWTEERGYNIPQTLTKGDDDNFDLIFLDGEGCFRELEISVSTRSGKFWLAIQEKSAGQVVRTTTAKAEKLGVKTIEVDGHTCFVAPLYPENAYPGADWVKISEEKGVGPKVVEYAFRHGASAPLSKCSVAEWSPIPVTLPDKMKANGWKTATTEWFNADLGWGFALCSDGKACLVHFKQILDANGRPVVNNGEFPILTPMRGFALKWADMPDGKRKATAIRII